MKKIAKSNLLKSSDFITSNNNVSDFYDDNNLFSDDAKSFQIHNRPFINEILQFLDSNIFGKTEVFFDGRREVVRTEETNLGNLIADANLTAAQNLEELDFLGVVPFTNETVSVSLVNGGNIGASIGEVGNSSELLPPIANPYAGKEIGDISELDIANTLPSNNSLTLLTVTREELKQLVEHGVAGASENVASDQFLQVAGLRFSFDPNQTRILFDSAESGNVITDGERVQNLELVNERGEIVDVIVDDGELQGDPNANLRLVTTDFLADGGDGYPFPAWGKDIVNVQNALGQLLFIDPFIQFDESRDEDTTSGLFFIDDTNVPVFDFSDPKAIDVDVEAGTLTIESDLLFSPEEGVAFQDEELPGTDGGDARIDAKIVSVGDNFEIVSGTTSINFDPAIFERIGLTLFDVDNGAEPVEGFDVGYRIVSNKEDNLIFNLEKGFTPVEGAIKHVGTATLEYLSDANFAPEGTEQDALAQYLAEFFPADDEPKTPIFGNSETLATEDSRIINLEKVDLLASSAFGFGETSEDIIENDLLSSVSFTSNKFDDGSITRSNSWLSESDIFL